MKPKQLFRDFTVVASLVSLTACNQIAEFNTLDSSNLSYITPMPPNHMNRLPICHYDEFSDSYAILYLPPQAITSHERHGDVLLIDQDGDGYYPDNHCGYYPMGDCNDLNPEIFPEIDLNSCFTIDENCDQIIFEDNDPPQLKCVQGLETYYDLEILASLIPSDFLISYSDNCTAKQDIILSMSKTEFTCQDVGSTEITITAIDQSGNANTCGTILKISDFFDKCN